MFRRISAFAILAMTTGVLHADAPLWINRPEAAPWLPALAAAADRTNLPPALIAELIGIESGFTNARNLHSSAAGFGQQIKGNRITARYGLDRMKPPESILAAALELRAGLDASGSVEGAALAYGTTVGLTPKRRKIINDRLKRAYADKTIILIPDNLPVMEASATKHRG